MVHAVDTLCRVVVQVPKVHHSVSIPGSRGRVLVLVTVGVWPAAQRDSNSCSAVDAGVGLTPDTSLPEPWLDLHKKMHSIPGLTTIVFYGKDSSRFLSHNREVLRYNTRSPEPGAHYWSTTQPSLSPPLV